MFLFGSNMKIFTPWQDHGGSSVTTWIWLRWSPCVWILSPAPCVDMIYNSSGQTSVINRQEFFGFPLATAVEHKQQAPFGHSFNLHDIYIYLHILYIYRNSDHFGWEANVALGSGNPVLPSFIESGAFVNSHVGQNVGHRIPFSLKLQTVFG